MNLDLFVTFRETTDWLIEKYNSLTNAEKKKQLNKIANHISKLATNKAVYLAVLKNELKANNEYVDLNKIHAAMRTAEADTQKLRILLDEIDLDSSKFTFSLKNGLETLTQLKQIKVNELKELISKDVVTIKDQKKVIAELESFEQKWIDLGKEIDKAFAK